MGNADPVEIHVQETARADDSSQCRHRFDAVEPSHPALERIHHGECSRLYGTRAIGTRLNPPASYADSVMSHQAKARNTPRPTAGQNSPRTGLVHPRRVSNRAAIRSAIGKQFGIFDNHRQRSISGLCHAITFDSQAIRQV